jgi:hypothetical protein
MTVKNIKNNIGKDLYFKLKKEKVKLSHIKFVVEYLNNGMNAGQAYLKHVAKKPDITMDTAYTNGCLLLRNPKIREALRIVITDWLEEKRGKLEKELIDVLYRRAFYDISIFQNENGEFKELEDIPNEWRCCVDGVEKKYYGKDATTSVIILKLADRDRAIDKLDKYIQMTKELSVDVGLTKDTVKSLDEIFNQNKRDPEIKK